MGMWDTKPYANDTAADWLGNLMSVTALRTRWIGSVKNHEEEPEVARAAVWLFIQLGYVYVWPIEDYAADLEKAIAAADALRRLPRWSDWVGLPEMLENEYEELLSRHTRLLEVRKTQAASANA